MDNNFLELKNKFCAIKDLGWVKSRRNGPTGIGYTFECLIGKNEDAFSLPDFKGIEIKTHRVHSKSYISLFNCSPIGESSYELMRLFHSYGYLHTKNRNVRSLNANIYCNYIKDVGINYKFSLKVDEIEKKIYLLVFDRLGVLIEKKSYWTFDALREKLYMKLRYLAYVEADYKFINGVEYFKYNKISFYGLKNFDSFIQLIKSAKIRVSFLISGDVSGNGCINSHGASFSIKSENLNLLFYLIN